MAHKSPIHRDPVADGADFGCVGTKATKGNRAIVRMVESVRLCLEAGDFHEGDELIDHLRWSLEDIEREYDCGCCDTVVKENVMAALGDAIEEAKLGDFESSMIYGW